MTLLPLIAICYIIHHQSPEDIQDWYHVYAFLFAFGVMLCFTNQFHKWAHTSQEKLPKVVVWLQKCHLILPPDHHRNHHLPPHEMYFCPCNGWCNYLLEAFGFWQKLEKLIEKVTGVRARSDDMKWALKTWSATLMGDTEFCYVQLWSVLSHEFWCHLILCNTILINARRTCARGLCVCVCVLRVCCLHFKLVAATVTVLMKIGLNF